MNPQQALQIVSQLIALAPVPLANHQQGQKALQVLQQAITPPPSSAKPEKKAEPAPEPMKMEAPKK